MKTLTQRGAFALTLLLSLTILPAAAQQQDTTTTPTDEQTEAARTAAEDWLTYVDAGDHAQSYDQAAEMLRSQVDEEQWATTLGNVQTQTGALQERSFADAQYTTQLPGVSAGEYVIVQYRSDYSNVSGQETVILTSEDGTWRVVGYAVQPGAPEGNQ